MELTGTGMKASGRGIGHASRPGTIFGMIRAARERWLDLRTRRALRDLDRLDDRLLNDVGLRDRLPSGAMRVVRF